jgi:hypothetical protein
VSTAHPAANTDSMLRALVARGFRFLDPRDENGDVVAVVGVRAHDDVVDVVQLHGEDEAVALRIPEGQDILRPLRVFWREEGGAVQVLASLLALADDQVSRLILPAHVGA